MNTMIFTWEPDEELYNDSQVMESLLKGETVDWCLWYNGDGRYRPTCAESGDRFYILQPGKGLIATGSVLSSHFVRGNSKLVDCGMVHLELQTEHYGPVVIPEDKISDLLSRAQRHREEIVVSNSTDREYLDALWVMAVLASKSEIKSI